MGRVNGCPRNSTDVVTASSRLGCGTDDYGNSQYMCLPNVQKTSLVEFCYGDVMGMQEKGNCLEVSELEGDLFLQRCTNFENGCPDEHFKSTDFYKYPACQMVDLVHNCYRLEPTCPGNKMNAEIEVHGSNNHLIDITIFWIYLGIVLLVIFIIIFGLSYWRIKNVRTYNRR
ncbi:uncharacterized protein LOC111102267 isoform X2 [Crassostrea virginica]